MFQSEKSSENLLLIAMDRYHKLDTIITLLEAQPNYFAQAPLTILIHHKGLRCIRKLQQKEKLQKDTRILC